MRIFKTKWFHRFAQKQQISDNELVAAINQIEQGLIDAQLGNGLIKQRIAKKGQGKSSGYRTIIVYQFQHFAIFVLGFEKSQKDNLTPPELQTLKQSASHYLNLTEQQITTLLTKQSLIEIPLGAQNE